MLGVNELAWFSALAGVGLKSAVILAIASVLSLALRRQSAALRHTVWTAAAAALIALPLLSVWLPAIPAPAGAAILPNFRVAAHATEHVPAAVQTHASQTHERDAATSSPVASVEAHWRTVLLLLWALGALFALIQMLLATIRMLRLRKGAEPSPDRAFANDLARTLGILQPVEVLESGDHSMPMTFGVLRPAVFMPRNAMSWADDRRRVVLLHELAHVRRGDAASHLLARLALILNWWNPLAWFAWREQLKESERAADDLVLNAGTAATDYASHLLEVARSMQATPVEVVAVPMARRSQLEARLRAILDSSSNRATAGRATALVAAVAAAIIVMPLAAIRAQNGASPSTPPDTDAMIRAARAENSFKALDRAATMFVAERQYESARKLLEASLAIRKQSSTVDYGVGLINLGDLEKRQNRLAEAEKYYAEAAQTLGDKPQAARALINLGVANLAAKRPEKAMDYFQTAQRINPEQAGAAWMWMALVREREQNPTDAEAMYRSALAVEEADSPQAATIMELYARLLNDAGRTQEAQPLLDRAKAIRSRFGSRAKKELSAGVYRIGGDVTAPKVLSKVEPQYTEEARLAKYSGTAVLSVEIGADGVPRNIQVVRGLGLGLDDNAVAAVSTWRFQPATKEGAPVPVAAQIEVNFRLM